MAHLGGKKYRHLLKPMQIELVAMARWVADSGARVVVVFEGRDAAGKGGAIKALSDPLNPRQCRTVALAKPTEREAGEWYFQRYACHLPSAGEIALFDRSWYNRAGVEKVMGFASDAQIAKFLGQVPAFEQQLVDDGILLFKYWLACDQKEQEKRLADRFEDPLKRWKLSPMDLAARHKYDEYSAAREKMLEASHTKWAPWTLVDFNDQKRGRLTLLRDFLDRMPEKDCEPKEPTLDPLRRKPEKERYGVLDPLPPFEG
ncbi:MAG: polyphosphate kinase 2 [Candidatus Andeanibacterium colombiense]|uniref:ADP/GDP-polyphosphate phosphotransferase n=1 Tax=Candidatus Andeanibacterium colombiense TaxID=3121345 RepID=A0AAJ6BNG0_9SPHN|nr:MAG: polyphosphate kinase 2 [Sphingomonadaceae bacterium]